MIGKGSVNHNTRAFTAKNIDKNRSVDNVEFCQEDIKQVYHKLFDEALERYNAKQKRKDRVIDDYYEKIRRGKQEKLFHEVIFQIGNKDDMNAKSEDGVLAKKILTEFMDEFQARNPNLYVFSAHLHMDEETPHLHIDFVPYITGSKRGLDTRVSLKSALSAEGFKGGTRGATELNQWIASEKQELAAVMERYDVEWLQKGTHEKHLSVLEFEKKERGKEVAEIASAMAQLGEEVSVKKQELNDIASEKQIAEAAVQKAKEESAVAQQENETLLANNQDLRVENSRLESRKDRLRMENHDLKQKQQRLQADNEELEQRHEDLQYTNGELQNVNDRLSDDNHTLEQRNDALQSDNQTLRQKYNDLQQSNVQLEKQQKELKSNIEKMVQSEELLQRDVRKYDEAPEWQLPEPGAFTSAKAFRDKVVLPLVNKLKSLVKNLTIQCVRLKEEVLKLRKEKRELLESVEFYKGKIRDMNERTELLQEKADDLERVKRYAGAEQIDTIIGKVKEQERVEQKARRYKRTYEAR